MELKSRLSRGEPTFGLWVTLESAAISEIAATLGLEWVVVDTEHGPLDFRETLDHVRAVARTRTAPLVRVPEIEEGTFKRVLDMGAEEILVPMVRSAEDVRRAVRFAKYPPEGIRGIAVERATQWGLGLHDYVQKATARRSSSRSSRTSRPPTTSTRFSTSRESTRSSSDPSISPRRWDTWGCGTIRKSGAGSSP